MAGPALTGSTLTAGPGVFAGESPVYTYKWERCAAEGSCEAISGATSSSYTLTSGDAGSSIRVLVSASNGYGSTTGVSSPTSEVRTKALAKLSDPSISGIVQFGGVLSADPGIWSAAGAVSYAYQWERCNASGEDCAAIDGATEQTYVSPTGEFDSTFRVTVTVTSPSGEESAVSAHTPGLPGSEVSVEEAQAILASADPAVIAASTTATLEEESIAPSLTDSGEELISEKTLTSSTVSKETVGEFAVNTPVGELSFEPTEVAPETDALPTIVNGSSALFANAWHATDAIVRPEPLGVAALLQIRSAEAPTEFSWEARLGPDQELKQLSNGSVAVVEASEDESEEGEVGANEPPQQTIEELPETSEEKAEVEQEEVESESEGEPPEGPPASPETHPTLGEATAGMPQPQQTKSSYEASKAIMSEAESQTSGRALMAVGTPKVTDAEGHQVAAKLSVIQNTITLTVNPGAEVVYPLIAELPVAAPSDKTSEERDPVKYGLSDPAHGEMGKEIEGHIDQHYDEEGKIASGLDPNLKNGPMHVKLARIVMPYDLYTRDNTYTKENLARLHEWLKKIKTAKLEPFVTISKDYEMDPCGEGEIFLCPAAPSVGEYKKSVEILMKSLVGGNKAKGYPPIKEWGSWNEPDAGINPLLEHPGKAAKYWDVANAIMARVAGHAHCHNCVVAAGEFAYFPGYESTYTKRYISELLYGLIEPSKGAKLLQTALPAVWSFHDYYDVVERQLGTAREFAHITDSLRKPRLFMTEGGVELLTGKKETEVLSGSSKVKLRDDQELQADAARTFLELHAAKTTGEKISRIDREYYYMYTSPTPEEQAKKDFDSALLEILNGERVERPAYCVLAYSSHVCPPVVGANQKNYTDGAGGCNKVPSSVKISGSIEPHGAGVTPEDRSGPCESFSRLRWWARKELQDEATQAHAGADRPQVAGVRADARRGQDDPGGGEGAGDQ